MADEKTIASELSRIQAARDTIRTKLGPNGMGILSQSEAENVNLSRLAEEIHGIKVDDSTTLEIKGGVDGTAVLRAGYYKNDIDISVEGSSGDYYLHGIGNITPTETTQTFNKEDYVSTEHPTVYGFESFTVNAIPKQYGNVNKIANATEEANYILTGHSAIIKGTDADNQPIAKYVKGTMANKGNLTIELGSLSGQTGTHTVAPGYYTGGTISLAADTVTTTDASAEADEILSGKTAYVRGAKVTGTIPTLNAANIAVDEDVITLGNGYYKDNVTKTLDHAVLQENVEYQIGTDGKISLEIDVNKSGYIAKGPISGTIQLAATGGDTIIPEKRQKLAVNKETYVTGDIYVAPIPDKYQDITVVTATADHVLKGHQIVGKDGTIVGGNITIQESPNVVLDTNKGQYTIDSGYYTGGTIQIQTEAKSATLQQGEQTISPTSGHVLSEVIVPGVETYLENKVNVTADQVVSGAHFVDAGGTERTGTMTVHTDDINWNYTEYDKFPIPAGAYVGESTFVSEWSVDIRPGDSMPQEGYICPGDYYQWGQIDISNERDEWMEFILSNVQGHHEDWYTYSIYVLPIEGNGNVISAGSLGVGASVGSRDSFSYCLGLKDGTIYFIYNGESPDPDCLAWVKDYTYGTSSVHVTMNELVDALAAI